MNEATKQLLDEAYDRRGRAYYEAAFKRSCAIMRATTPAETAAAHATYRAAVREADEAYRSDCNHAYNQAKRGVHA